MNRRRPSETFMTGNIVNLEAEVILYSQKLADEGHPGREDPERQHRFRPLRPRGSRPQKGPGSQTGQVIWRPSSNPDVSKLTNYLVKKFRASYVDWPAAVKNHHNYVSGLLYHSLTMADLAEKVCEIYPSLNRDVLVAGTLIHDIGKTLELSGPVATQFTLEGKLLGHISIMQAEIREAAKELNMTGEIPVIMEHMVLIASHQTRIRFARAAA
jgi:putative nucleotidyltransferase with HDIG domain